MMLNSKIEITKSPDSDEWDINIENVNVHYLPELLGNVMSDAFENPAFNPATDEQIRALKVIAVSRFIDKLGLQPSDLISSNWVDLESRKPNHEGPFICIEKSYPDKVYANMYWDKEKQIFGTRDGNGYAFITHWQEVPKF